MPRFRIALLPFCDGLVYHESEIERVVPMPDIELRFNKDMLVLSAPLDASLLRSGVDLTQDREFFNLIEPEAVRDAFRIEMLSGAQCLVTNTSGITTARLTHVNMEDRALELATAALTILTSLKPQHIFAEIGSTRLPLDASSAASLKQNRDQYAQAVRDFGEEGIDAYFLNKMVNPADMQCALMGVRKQSDKPIIASLILDDQGKVGSAQEDAADAMAMMVECGANIVGFESALPLEEILPIVSHIKTKVHTPLLVQLVVRENNPHQQRQTKENPYYCPDTMIEAATQLRAAGVQFLRASGNASAAYTGALVAASAGFDVMLKETDEANNGD